MRQLVYIMFVRNIAHRFTCGERKIWKNIQKSQNIMKMIVSLYSKNAIFHLFHELDKTEKVQLEQHKKSQNRFANWEKPGSKGYDQHS